MQIYLSSICYLIFIHENKWDNLGFSCFLLISTKKSFNYCRTRRKGMLILVNTSVNMFVEQIRDLDTCAIAAYLSFTQYTCPSPFRSIIVTNASTLHISSTISFFSNMYSWYKCIVVSRKIYIVSIMYNFVMSLSVVDI